jgi:hypothetical protein
VVSAELRAGAVDRAGRLAVRELVAQFDRLGRIVTPDARSWHLAGDALGNIRLREPSLRAKVTSLWGQVRKKCGRPDFHRPSTFDQGVGGSIPPRLHFAARPTAASSSRAASR